MAMATDCTANQPRPHRAPRCPTIRENLDAIQPSNQRHCQSGAPMNQQSLSALIWSVADLLRGDFKPHEYGRVILPFTVLRRLDCVLAPTKAAALAEYESKKAAGIAHEAFVLRAAKQSFFNISSLDLPRILGDQDHIRPNLLSYIQGFSDDVRDIFNRFDFAVTVDRLHKANLLYLVTERFTKNLDLHRACPRFCVNGSLAGDCRQTRRHHEPTQA